MPEASPCSFFCSHLPNPPENSWQGSPDPIYLSFLGPGDIRRCPRRLTLPSWRENIQELTQRMDDRIGCDGLLLLIHPRLTRVFDNEPERESRALAAGHIL